MFILNGKYCAVKTWFHDLPKNQTQSTLYRYDTEQDMLDSKNEISSDIFVFIYSPSLHSLEGIEHATQIIYEATQVT